MGVAASLTLVWCPQLREVWGAASCPWQTDGWMRQSIGQNQSNSLPDMRHSDEWREAAIHLVRETFWHFIDVDMTASPHCCCESTPSQRLSRVIVWWYLCSYLLLSSSLKLNTDAVCSAISCTAGQKLQHCDKARDEKHINSFTYRGNMSSFIQLQGKHAESRGGGGERVFHSQTKTSLEPVRTI